ncbi:SDR family oxidoreductase [Rudaea sp.]|uniref:SDR family NAD(P)-dependent oxidoreductase n=1 Tax=Rudaea sp. TaxID=2136325 RepID=UPI002ED48125
MPSLAENTIANAGANPIDPSHELTGRTAMIVGASRGIGRGIALAFAGAGARVIAVSRSSAEFPEAGAGTGEIKQEIADAGDAALPALILDRHEPDVVVLVAGAIPPMLPLQQQSWETFSANWQADVRIAFHWLRAILLKPLRPGSRVVVFSSGAALGGSPLSGGYAGAKAMQRFLSAYAQNESARGGLGITFTAVLPRFSPQTGVGKVAVQAYATRAGQSVEAFLDSFVRSSGPLLSPQIAGAALLQLAMQDAADFAPAYLLTGAGLQKLPS